MAGMDGLLMDEPTEGTVPSSKRDPLTSSRVKPECGGVVSSDREKCQRRQQQSLVFHFQGDEDEAQGRKEDGKGEEKEGEIGGEESTGNGRETTNTPPDSGTCDPGPHGPSQRGPSQRDPGPHGPSQRGPGQRSPGPHAQDSRPRKPFPFKILILGGASWSKHLFVALLHLLLLCSASMEPTYLDDQILPQGQDAVVPFTVKFSPGAVGEKSYNLKLSERPIPFVTDDVINNGGFSHESQGERFSVTSMYSNDMLTVTMTILSVIAYDQGTYSLIFHLYSPEGKVTHTASKIVKVYIPPGKAKCSIVGGLGDMNTSVKCNASKGSGNTTLTCFQQNIKLVPNIYDTGVSTGFVMGIFRMNPSSPVSCCSHEIGHDKSPELCSDWPPDHQPDPSLSKAIEPSHPHDIVPHRSGSSMTRLVNVLYFLPISLVSYWLFAMGVR